MSWLCRGAPGPKCIVEWSGDGGMVWFAPDRWGKVPALFQSGGLTVDFDAVRAAAEAMPRPKRGFGSRCSSERKAYCEAIAAALNARGIRPQRGRR